MSKREAVMHPHSPQIVTPSSTPPPLNPFPSSFNEARLTQLLSNFDSGTHSFDREDRDAVGDRRMSFGEIFGTPSSSRRGSFLSGLSLTRPGFSFSAGSGHSTPVHTPLSGSHPKESLLQSLHMTSSSAISDEPDIDLPTSKSLTHLPQVPPPNQKKQDGAISNQGKAPGQMFRSNSTPQGHVTVTGFAVGQVQGKIKQPDPSEMERRHFDPSKEPRLLNIL